MRVHATDPTVVEHLRAVTDRLLISGRFERFEDCDHLLDFSLTEVADQFWPVEDGWRRVSIETGFFYVMHTYTHPVLGFGASLIGAVEPGAGVGSPQTWDALDVAMRARNIAASSHVQGVTPLDLLDLFVDLHEARATTSTDVATVGFLASSSAFMDETTSLMVGLSDRYQDFLGRAAERRVRVSG